MTLSYPIANRDWRRMARFEFRQRYKNIALRTSEHLRFKRGRIVYAFGSGDRVVGVVTVGGLPEVLREWGVAPNGDHYLVDPKRVSPCLWIPVSLDNEGWVAWHPEIYTRGRIVLPDTKNNKAIWYPTDSEVFSVSGRTVESYRLDEIRRMRFKHHNIIEWCCLCRQYMPILSTGWTPCAHMQICLTHGINYHWCCSEKRKKTFGALFLKDDPRFKARMEEKEKKREEKAAKEASKRSQDRKDRSRLRHRQRRKPAPKREKSDNQNREEAED